MTKAAQLLSDAGYPKGGFDLLFHLFSVRACRKVRRFVAG